MLSSSTLTVNGTNEEGNVPLRALGSDHYISIKKQLSTAPSEQKNPTQVCFYQPPWCQRLQQDQPCVVPFAGLGAELSGRAALAWWNSRWAPSSYDRILAPSARHSESLTQCNIQLFKLQLKERYFWPGCQGFIKSFSVNQSNFPLTSLCIFPPHTLFQHD